MGLRKGWGEHSIVKKIERIRREEEERRRSKAKALPNRDCDLPLHCSSFSVLRAMVS